MLKPCSSEDIVGADKPDEHVLSVIPLARTCRTIYAELDYFQPFYNFNHFAFGVGTDLCKYLAAITPSRRQAVRQTRLETFTFIVSFCSLHEYEEILKYLDRCLEFFSGYFRNATLRWFQLQNLEQEDETINTSAEDINEAWEAHRRRLGTDKPEWFKQLNDPILTRDALFAVEDLDILRTEDGFHFLKYVGDDPGDDPGEQEEIRKLRFYKGYWEQIAKEWDDYRESVMRRVRVSPGA
ncbi:hypothetical protein F5Y11DRAFT_364145 [Daldinia sp. FL1419]|nr:hypothetical protein F5Y11DRAFT_364145 [Daldinia sp. FL1419]